MYKIMTAYDRIRLPAQFFSMKLKSGLSQILREKFERRIDKESGIVLSIWNVSPEGDGTVIPADGAAYYDVKFEVLAYLPEINEVIEANVTEIVDFGAFIQIGSVEGLIHLSQITNDFLSYNKKNSCFIGKESKKSLRKGDVVLAKISTISLKQSLTDTKVGLTMRPEGLGKLDWIEVAEKKAANAVKNEKSSKKKKEKKE